MSSREQREAFIRHATNVVRGGILGVGRSQRLPYLHHSTVEISPEEVPACMEFYEQVLGLSVVKSPIQKSAWFEQGVHLYWGAPVADPESDVAARHIALVVGIEYIRIRERCKKLGLFITEGTAYWGSPRCFVMDPAHNRIELMERAP